MNDIKGTVEFGKPYNVHDAAMVQIMLVLIKNTEKKPYLSIYDGDWGTKSDKALKAFQKDHVVQAGPTRTGHELGLDGPRGQVKKGSATILKLNSMLPKDRKELLVLDGSAIVYLPGAKADTVKSKTSVSSSADLNGVFREKAAKVISEMYEKYKLVVAPTRTGLRRSFLEQYNLRNNVTAKGKYVTGAGAGESNHQFGQAIDLGFKGIQWFKRDGKLVKEKGDWLNALGAERGGAAKALTFWQALRATGYAQGLHKTTESDRPHLQLSKEPVHMRERLAAHLTAVTKSQKDLTKVKWEAGSLRSGRFGTYECDFGLGGGMFNVGSANAIWEGKATVKKADLAAAQSAANKKADPKAKAIDSNTIKEKELTEMKQTLQKIFKLADAKWADWKAK